MIIRWGDIAAVGVVFADVVNVEVLAVVVAVIAVAVVTVISVNDEAAHAVVIVVVLDFSVIKLTLEINI